MVKGSWSNIEYDSRTILLTNIESADVKDIITYILHINYYDQINLDNDKKYKPEPIRLMIDSFGGETYEAFGLIDIINNSVTPIHTYGVGSVMSASLPVFLAGSKRYAYKLCSFMYHEVTTDYEGKARGQIENAEECKRIMAIFDKQITSNCKIKQSELDKVKSTKKDWYFTAQEAKKLGIVQEIL